MASLASSSTSFSHIGLFGRGTGTLKLVKGTGAEWTSSKDDSKVTINGARIVEGCWSEMGKMCYLRIRARRESGEGEAAPSAGVEYRFDGFKAAEKKVIGDLIGSGALGGAEMTDVKWFDQKMHSGGSSFGLGVVMGGDNSDSEDDSNNPNIGRRKHAPPALTLHQSIPVFSPADANNAAALPVSASPGAELFSVPLENITQCVQPGNARNDIEIQFEEDDKRTAIAGGDELVQIRFFVPNTDADGAPNDPDSTTNAEKLRKQILAVSSAVSSTSSSEPLIASFDEEMGIFETPRGKYALQLYSNYVRLHGQKYDYKVKYDDISKFFLLPRPDDLHYAFVIVLDTPIRQGQQKYKHLVMKVSKAERKVDINLSDEVKADEKYSDLHSTMTGASQSLLAKVFKIVTGKKVFVPPKSADDSGGYDSAHNKKCVTCSLKANEGHLYPLNKQLVFLHKPVVIVHFSEIDYIEFQRFGGNAGSSAMNTTKNFDLAVNLKKRSNDSETREYIFSGIAKNEYSTLLAFVQSKKVRIKNLKSNSLFDSGRRKSYNEGGSSDEDVRGGGEDDENSSDDEDFNAASASESEDTMNDSDDSSIMSDASDDMVDELRAKQAKGGNLDVDEEKPKKRKAKSKAQASGSPKKTTTKKKGKKKKDPNAPKNATSAYQYFSNEERARIKEAEPDLAFGEIASKISAAWKLVGDRSKYESLARADKERYALEMKSYVPPSDDSDSDGDDAKPVKKKKASPKKKAAKDPNAPKGAKGSYMFFSASERARIKEQNPDLTFGEIAKKVGEEWKATEDKSKWETLAAEDKARFERETEAYEKMKKEAMAMLSSDSDSSDVSSDSDDEPVTSTEKVAPAPVKAAASMDVDSGDDGLGMVSSGDDSDSD